MMRAVIVDDEYYALEGLRMELEDIGGIEVIGRFEDGETFLLEVKELSPDVIFLDIEMPKMNGFQLLERLVETGVKSQIIFATAYDHYAVRAFEVNAIDYIVKPITRSRLMKTLERIQPEWVANKNIQLKINCFRHFSILVNDKEANKGWRTRKAEELIAYLLCEKGRFVSKEKIAETLWPEQNSEQCVSNLYLAYYYIKKQESKLGIKFPIESERGKMRICTEDLECDLILFDRLIEDSATMNIPDSIVLLEKAADLYRGMLFEDGYYSWASEYQQQYEYRYGEVVRRLIDFYESRADDVKLKYYSEKYDVI